MCLCVNGITVHLKFVGMPKVISVTPDGIYSLFLFIVLFMLLWIALYAALVHIISGETYEFHFGYAATLPLVSILLLFLARKGIIHDEKLIKSIDRIR